MYCHMKMNARTVGWLVFLAIIKNVSCYEDLFKVTDRSLMAKEGSCIELKWELGYSVRTVGAYWFWLKDAEWVDEVLTGTVIYSTDETTRPVDPDFAARVTYNGSPSSSWVNYRSSSSRSSKKVSILICDLRITDSGGYSFRFVGRHSWLWVTKPPVILTVTDNPCLITFEKPPVVKERETVTLTCSTLRSCRSELQIRSLTQPSLTNNPTADQMYRSTVSLTADWNDDGREFSCQTSNEEDKSLIRKISLSVEYAPRDTLAEITSGKVVEGQTMTLTCSAKGRPEPNFTWFRNGQQLGTGAAGEEWVIRSIKESEKGNYHCEARNKHGEKTSQSLTVDVEYKPVVEAWSSASTVMQGSKMTLTCNVTRSNPQPHAYVWFKDRMRIGEMQTLVIERIQSEDRGAYTCKASNNVGTGESNPFEIEVQYAPGKTTLSITKHDEEVFPLVGVGSILTFSCDAVAYPAPQTYSWYRYRSGGQLDSSQWKSKTTQLKWLRLDSVKRADEGCYRCNATNIIDTGKDSEEKCIQVVYAPTEPTLSMESEVREGQLVTIGCSVESFPPSQLTLMRPFQSKSSTFFTQPADAWPANTLQHAFNVTSAHEGFYTCIAKNRKDSKTSKQRMLVVKYHPKDVTVEALPALVVNENQPLTLRCTARSDPPVTSVTWTKKTEGKSEIIGTTPTFDLKSVRPADSGLYSCVARNNIGTGNSRQAEVKVKYAPKHTKITRVAEHQQPDGTTAVALSCSSHSDPVSQYAWYKVKDGGRDEKVSDHQNHTVYSDQPGAYYCIAKNDIDQMSSEPLHLFDRSLTKALSIFFVLFILLVILIIVLGYRHKRKKSNQQGAANNGFLAWWRDQTDDPGMAGPFRSRDDLLREQPHRPNGQRCQPLPDSTPASGIDSVYCTVNLPSGQQGSSAPKTIRQQVGHEQEDSLNYASLYFGDEEKNKQSNMDVYAVVSKQKQPKKNEERLEDYENVSTAPKARDPTPSKSDTDTSEDEVEVNYSQVSFKVKPGRQRASRDSSSSDEEATQYSEVNI